MQDPASLISVPRVQGLRTPGGARGSGDAHKACVNPPCRLYWLRIIPLGQTSSIAFPFSRLDREPFWQLVPQPGTSITPAIINNTSSVSYLRKYALGAMLDEGLFRILQSGEGREALREALQPTLRPVRHPHRHPRRPHGGGGGPHRPVEQGQKRRRS